MRKNKASSADEALFLFLALQVGVIEVLAVILNLTGVYYMDVLSELEKIGDFMINISQAVRKNNEN